ncbi:MAG: hypothetical protein WCQ72_02160 [Eubacteriales bacterium]
MAAQKRDWDKIIELIIVIMLGITALLTAWASWIGSLHGGNQATNYTTSNNIASEGNSEYNAGVQQMNQDMLLWNDISDMQIEIIFANAAEDEVTVTKLCYQLFYKLNENLSEEMANSIGWNYQLTEEEQEDPTGTILAWLEDPQSMTSPFTEQEYVDSYFVTANELLTQSQEVLAQGTEDNSNGDAFGLVTVIYSVVLFLLGIAGSFKSDKNKLAVVIISLVAFVIATIYMVTIPMPTGFDILAFLKK